MVSCKTPPSWWSLRNVAKFYFDSLANMVSPIGVAEYKLLPKAEDLQKQIDEL